MNNINFDFDGLSDLSKIKELFENKITTLKS
jgi:hypothetical protein